MKIEQSKQTRPKVRIKLTAREADVLCVVLGGVAGDSSVVHALYHKLRSLAEKPLIPGRPETAGLSNAKYYKLREKIRRVSAENDTLMINDKRYLAGKVVI